MADTIDYVEGLFIKEPNPKAPDFVKAKGSIKKADMIAWLKTVDDEWVNFDVKVSKAGKWYCAVDNWKPDAPATEKQLNSRPAPAPPVVDDDLPF